MAKLKKAEQLFIVRSLAQFMTPTEVVKAIKETFNITVSPQQVEAYDPTKVAGRDLRKEYKEVFESTREEYLKQPIHNISGANDIVQLKILSDLLFAKKNNVTMTIKIVDQMQKIMKGFYEKRLEITGAGGGPLKTENTNTPSPPAYTPEELSKLSPQELSRLVINGKL
ncbi:TPA: DUF2280 domain-containing protein [Acinetobacter baumannii]|uniref:DUF2280 domain-containing protein n=1 Tax=Acinetobacter baumannii TaxID=470 RepID=UPI0007E92DC0|nr:DUF2280 domain-containing protein [Acinetobacter baumannii]SBS21259.1 phage-like protein,Uncharacterized conserved protein,Uncharacterized conserved protein (DUF2280) [Acinetobacter baumannii]HAV2932518.1 DUF2280 domain-containing protein [Acinetobacter baumannii]HAV3087508.1 DUF2280 domain-containing protein [Acinetobacter baumannii]HAV4615536.1 DUF2280 domain-containing protein [Acinetobacter baumannii]HAV4622424.1 DUF2280 domain-containing protein [Acinetobacter baumannii]